MYGMVHNGVRAMVVERLGEREWLRIERESRIGPAEFIGLTVYDDALTFRIVEIAAQALDLQAADYLREFGRYWITFAEKGSFGAIMDFTGSDLVSFISNLDRMHRAVAATMPRGSMPSFVLNGQSTKGLSILYRSDRVGLERFVVGLLEGLLNRFSLEGDVQHVGRNHDGSEEFTIAISR